MLFVEYCQFLVSVIDNLVHSSKKEENEEYSSQSSGKKFLDKLKMYLKLFFNDPTSTEELQKVITENLDLKTKLI